MPKSPPSLDFDLAKARRSAVALQATIPPDAFTASILGEKRAGSAVLIRESGLLLTIGYLITEAEEIWLTDWRGRVTQAVPVAVDQTTGFGLVQALGRLDVPAIPLAPAGAAAVGEASAIISGGEHPALPVEIVAIKPFAGPWEYLIEGAIYTAPAHPFWGGAGLLSRSGELLGIGSLHLEQEGESEAPSDLNMVVPVDLLTPALDHLMRFGKPPGPARPWLGLFGADYRGRVVTAGVVDGGPAETSGIQRGDFVEAVGGTSVKDIAGLFRALWALGPAGVEAPLTIERDGKTVTVSVKTIDRNQRLKKPRLQ